MRRRVIVVTLSAEVVLCPIAEAGRRRIELRAVAHHCNSVCEFSLCLEGEMRPAVGMCPREVADVTVLVPIALASPTAR